MVDEGEYGCSFLGPAADLIPIFGLAPSPPPAAEPTC
jgi:hypothetical protein